MSRPFTVLLVGAAIWGVSLGLAFILGITVGRVQTGDAPATAISSPAEAAQEQPQQMRQQFRDQDGQIIEMDEAQMEQLRQRMQSGELSQEELQQMRQQFQGQGGPPGGQRQFGPGAQGSGTSP